MDNSLWYIIIDMIILLGTTSEQKINIAKQFFKEKNIIVDFVPTEVNSDISDQPFGEDLIIQGSINRARNAIQNTNNYNYDLSIGFEGGIGETDTTGYYLCAISILDAQKNVYTGVSRKNPIPDQVMRQVKNGAYFATVIREFEKDISNESAELQRLVSELIHHTESFLEALDLAWVQYKNSPYFK